MSETTLTFGVSIVCYIVSLFFLQRLASCVIKNRKDPKAGLQGEIRKNVGLFLVSLVVFWVVYLFLFFGGTGFTAKDIIPFIAGNIIAIMLGFV